MNGIHIGKDSVPPAIRNQERIFLSFCFSVSIFQVRPVLYITFREMSQLSRCFTGNAFLWLEQLTC